MNYLTSGQASSLLGISNDTLRRWDKKGQLKPNKIDKKTSYRYYKEENINNYLKSLDIFKLAFIWAKNKKAKEPQKIFYCNNISFLSYKLTKFENELMKINEFKESYSLLTSMAAEIGINSFDHNLGNWPDIPGIFFAYNIKNRTIVLADRGQGILRTLSRVKPDIKNDQEALNIAFTEIVSGRAPESRGNGLKYVKRIITKTDNFSLKFYSGTAELFLKHQDKNLKIKTKKDKIKGCLALIRF